MYALPYIRTSRETLRALRYAEFETRHKAEVPVAYFAFCRAISAKITHSVALSAVLCVDKSVAGDAAR